MTKLDYEGAEAMRMMASSLKQVEPDARERMALALYWVERWGQHYNTGQFAGRVSWWRGQHMVDKDRKMTDDTNVFVERGRDHYRLMADAALAMNK